MEKDIIGPFFIIMPPLTLEERRNREEIFSKVDIEKKRETSEKTPMIFCMFSIKMTILEKIFAKN